MLLFGGPWLASSLRAATPALLSEYPNHEFFITGDFNHVDVSCFESSFNLLNIITQPTRFNAVIDLLLIPDHLTDRYKNAKILPPLGASDHNVIIVEPIKSFSKKTSFTKVLDFRDSHVVKALAYLSNIDWVSTFDAKNLDQACETFYTHLNIALALLPHDIVKARQSDKPWISKVMKVLINKRFKAYRERNWTLFKHFKQKVKKIFLLQNNNGESPPPLDSLSGISTKLLQIVAKVGKIGYLIVLLTYFSLMCSKRRIKNLRKFSLTIRPVFLLIL